MRLPPDDDPSWKDFAKYHQDYLEYRPNLEEDIEENFRFLAELYASNPNEQHTGNATLDKTGRNFISTRYLVEPGEAHITVYTPYDNAVFTVSWRISLENDQAPELTFSWKGTTDKCHQWFVVLLSSDTLLPLAEPFPLGLASADGSKELPADLVDPTQPLAFRLILADITDAERVTSGGQPEKKIHHSARLLQTQSIGRITKRRLAATDRSKIIQSYRAVPEKERRPPIAYQPRAQEPQSLLLLKDKAAGTTLPFPAEQPLPLEWFDGNAVKLKFYYDRALGRWYVSRQGSAKDFFMQFWGEYDPLGSPILVRSRETPLPEIEFKKVALIEIYFSEDDSER